MKQEDPTNAFGPPPQPNKIIRQQYDHLIPNAKKRLDLIVKINCYVKGGVITPHSNNTLVGRQKTYGIKQVTFPKGLTGDLIAYLFKGKIVKYYGFNEFCAESDLTKAGVDFVKKPMGSGISFNSIDLGTQLNQMMKNPKTAHYALLFHERNFEEIEPAFKVQLKKEVLIDQTLVDKIYLNGL